MHQYWDWRKSRGSEELSAKIEWFKSFLLSQVEVRQLVTENLMRWTTFNSAPLSHEWLFEFHTYHRYFLLIFYTCHSVFIIPILSFFSVFIFNLMVLEKVCQPILSHLNKYWYYNSPIQLPIRKIERRFHILKTRFSFCNKIQNWKWVQHLKKNIWICFLWIVLEIL
jgi:hypothetical protein